MLSKLAAVKSSFRGVLGGISAHWRSIFTANVSTTRACQMGGACQSFYYSIAIIGCQVLGMLLNAELSELMLLLTICWVQSLVDLAGNLIL